MALSGGSRPAAGGFGGQPRRRGRDDRLAGRGQHRESEQLQAERCPVLEMGQPDVQDAGAGLPGAGAREPGQLGQRGGGRRHMRGGYGPVPGVRPDVADELHFPKAPTRRWRHRIR